MTYRPTFFVRRQARLAARLQLMVYCWRFARRAGGRTIVLWPPMDPWFRRFDGPRYWPSQIFDLESFYVRGGAESLVFLEGQFPRQTGTRSLEDPPFETARREGFDPEAFAVEGPPFFETRPPAYAFRDEPRDLAYLRASLRETYELLPRHRAVERTLRRSLAALRGPFVALHVRRGDVVETLRREAPLLDAGTLPADRLESIVRAYAGRTAPVDAYFPEVERALAEGRKIVLFSDSPDAFAPFAARFGAGVVDAATLPAAPAPLQKAFVDFNLLMAADRIVGASGSIFASFPAMLGAGDLRNVAGTASLAQMERELFDVHLAGLALAPATRQALADELARRYAETVEDARLPALRLPRK